VFDTYGNATKMSLIEETSTIYNLLQDLELKYSAEVAAVGLEQWVAELGTRNEAYEALVRSRFAEAATKTDIVLRDARDQIDVSYTGMCDLLGAYMLVQGEAAYEAFVRALNVMVAKFNAIRHHHKNHATQEAPVIRD